jgi:hypothetical protein
LLRRVTPGSPRFASWQAFQPQYWFYEVVGMSQRVLVACIGLLLPDVVRPAYILLVSTFFTVTMLKVTPFVFPADSLLAGACATSIWLATLFGYLIHVGAILPGTTVFEVFGWVLAATQLAMPALCVYLLAVAFAGYAWQLFVGKHAAAVEPEVLRAIHPTRRLSMMLSLKKRRITAIARAAQVRGAGVWPGGRVPVLLPPFRGCAPSHAHAIRTIGSVS